MTEQPNSQEQEVHLLNSLLPCTCSKSATVVENLNKTLKNVFPDNVKIQITYTGRKLSNRFQIKDETNKKHKHNSIYYEK